MINYLNRELKVRKQFAQADDTLPDILTALSQDSNVEVRLVVAGNPNTPVNVLQKLGEEFPDAITDNPIFNLLLLENLDTYFIKLSLARSSTTSAEILTQFANARYYSEEEIVRAVANNPNAPISVLEKLAIWFPEIEENSEETDGDFVHAGVASNLKTPVYILEELAKHRSEYVREQVAKNINASVIALETLVKNSTESCYYSNVLLAVANNPNTPLSITISLLEYLAGEDKVNIRQAVLKHPHVTNTAIKIVDFVNKNFKKKPGITLELLEKLAVDKRRHILHLVASHPLASAEILETLSHDEDANVRYQVIKHKNTSSETLQKLAVWLVEDIKKRGNRHYYTPIHIEPVKDLMEHPNRNFFFNINILK
jgi:hypothetical protein